MGMHIELDDELVAQIDALTGLEVAARRRDSPALHPTKPTQQSEGLPYEKADGRALARWPMKATSRVRAIGTPGR
jgi:hypothetical protein